MAPLNQTNAVIQSAGLGATSCVQGSFTKLDNRSAYGWNYFSLLPNVRNTAAAVFFQTQSLMKVVLITFVLPGYSCEWLWQFITSSDHSVWFIRCSRYRMLTRPLAVFWLNNSLWRNVFQLCSSQWPSLSPQLTVSLPVRRPGSTQPSLSSGLMLPALALPSAVGSAPYLLFMLFVEAALMFDHEQFAVNSCSL